MKVMRVLSMMIGVNSMLYASQAPINSGLSQLEESARQAVGDFRRLQTEIDIPVVSQSIVTQDSNALKDALQDIILLNRTITSQIDTAIGFWNLYLDSIQAPTKDTYLLGQVMSSFLGTMRSLFLRSNIDQAMILSLIKKNFDHSPTIMDTRTAVESHEVKIEDRWKNLHM